ncbi:hypothetical protein SK128_007250, partial [Halocaridina rubra]
MKVKMRTFLMEYNQSSHRQRKSARDPDMITMVPLGVSGALTASACPNKTLQTTHLSSGMFVMDIPLQEKDDSSGYSSSQAHSFRSYHDISSYDRPPGVH